MSKQKTGADRLRRTLSRRVLEAEETLQAICAGEVDAVVVDGPSGQQVYTLESPDQPFRIFVEQMQEGALTLDGHGGIVYCNRFFADLMMCPLEQTRGRLVQDFMDAAAQAQLATLLVDAKRGPVHHECHLRALDGELRPVQLAINALPDEQSEMFGVVVTDLAERERARELEVRRRTAEEATAARDQFLAVVSHELRTPLNAILGWTQLLRRRDDIPGRLQHALQVIERNAWSQAQLIDDLLDVSRVLAGKLRLERQPLDLNAVVEAAVGSIQPAADARDIRVQVRRADATVKVEGDPGRLQQVVWNLLSNAVKFTPDGGEIVVDLRTRDRTAEVSVRDSGIGIRPELLPQLFELYRQVEGATTRRSGGLGLGLAIVKQLAELHGGSVGADSEGEGRGATFTVRLPISAAPTVKPEPPAAAADRGSESLNGTRVLVVEDDEDARTMLAEVLKSVGADVLTATTAAEALEHLAQGEVADLLISDIGLPEMDGYALIRQIRASGRSGRDLPAVALTAFAGSEDRRRALLSGYQVHISKPVDQAELIAVVASLGRGGIG